MTESEEASIAIGAVRHEWCPHCLKHTLQAATISAATSPSRPHHRRLRGLRGMRMVTLRRKAGSMADLLTDLLFWTQIAEDSKRTVACSPADAPRIREAVEAAGMAGILTVIASLVVPDGQAYVMDIQAMDAYFNEAMQHHPPRPPW